MSLETQTTTRLRGLLESLGGKVTFAESRAELLDKIAARQREMMPAPKEQLPTIHLPTTDEEGEWRELVQDALAPLVSRGLRLTFPTNTTWHLAYFEREDSGNASCDMTTMIRCAKALMNHGSKA